MPVEFNDPQLFINRELSWLAFNERVLDDARDRELPLYERLKFFAIASSNLDEFFMVRVAGLKQQLASGVAETAADRMLPAEQLSAISERAHGLVDAASRLWVEELLPGLAAAGVSLLTRDKLTAEQKAAARTCFTTSVFPALTPLAVDPGHPFPHLRNKSLNVAVLLRREGPKRRRNVRGTTTSLAVVQVPGVMGRLVPMPSEKGSAFLLLGELIALCAGDLFPGYVVEHAATFRVTRNWDLNVDEEESEDLLSTIQDELRRRDRGAAVRLELDAVANPQIETQLVSALKLSPMDVYRQQAPLQPLDLMALTDLDPRPELRVEPFTPTVPAVLRDSESLLDVIAARDLLLHHPYESFEPVVRFLEEAAEDPDVLAIKQTLYRTSGDSPIARALSRAVENGKQVAVLVEIKARLDEANNIAWARKMEESGVHVVYGLIGLKTHAKVALVVRREGNGIRRYVHLGTGNYNPHTARLYTDLSLFTSRAEIADDVSALFNMLTGYAVAPQWKRLAVAPMGLHEKVLALIQREADKARRGEPARIVAKMNSLVDPTVIRALYAASQAGVEIDLLVRGICCLRPGVPGVSERIRVTSVVDRFLEHSRVFAFGTGGQTEVWMSSADWMPRNFLRRIEVMFPVEEPAIRQRLLDEVLGVALGDNVKARRLGVDATYVPVGRDGTAVRSQAVLMELARRNNNPDAKPLHALRHATAPERRDEPLVRPVPQTAT
ncbi:polyphosphate kinase 1 [Archangium sp.]|uniref:polyphosphate kinase 1 n=1 Tax=Archangium sp. TaxID=1872627 RepID=UPI00389A9206